MSVIAMFNQKGGSGKTMLSVHLAVAAYLAGRKVAILDLDPQGSASAWAKFRSKKTEPVIVAVPEGSLDRAIAGALADGFDFILLDAPPSVSPLTAKIIGASDLVVIPIRPEPLDVAAIPATLKLVGNARHVFVLSDCPQRAPEILEIKLELEKIGTVIGQVNNWRSFWRALMSGESVAEFEPGGVASVEIQEIFEAIVKELQCLNPA